MKHRTLGRTAQSVSEIGYGAWGIGGDMWGPTDDAESLRSLRRAFELGVTFFDTAYVYGNGHSEELVAKACAETGARPFIATKCPPKNMQWPAGRGTEAEDAFPDQWIIRCTERSLRKLKTDHVDLQQFHVWSDSWLDQGSWREAVERLKSAGKIRYFGVSINDNQPASALKLAASGVVDTVQVIYNIFEQAPAQELFPLCQEKNVGVIVRVPFDEGGLTGTLTPDTKFAKGDFRARYFKGDRLPETCARAEALKEQLGPHAQDLPALALRFVLAHPAVAVVIPGMRKVPHVEANCAASNGKALPDDVRQALGEAAWSRNFY